MGEMRKFKRPVLFSVYSTCWHGVRWAVWHFFQLPGYVDDANTWMEWVGMSLDWMVIIILLAPFALGAVTLWVLEHVEARFGWKNWPRTKKEKLHDLSTHIAEAETLDRASRNDPEEVFRFYAKIKVVQAALRKCGFHFAISDGLDWAMFITELAPLARAELVEEIQGLCDKYSARGSGDDDPTVVNTVRVS